MAVAYCPKKERRLSANGFLSENQILATYPNCRYHSDIRYSSMNVADATSQTLVTALQLGELLKSTRKHRKLTQAEVAARLGLSQNRISYLEQHPDEISFKQLLGWCAAVGLELRLGERVSSTPTNRAEW